MLFPKKVIISATTLSSSSSSSVWLLVFFACVTLSTALSTSDQQQQQPQQLSDTSSYGERLAESSYVFNSIANGGSGSFGSSSSQKEASSDGSGSYYSPGVSALLNSDGFLNTMSKFSPGGAEGAKYTPSGPVEAAVHTKKTIEVIPVRFEEPKEGEPQVIEISPYEVPLSIVFKTATNKINVNQEHRSETPEEVKETTSEEEPHRVVHNVYRPVIQEVTEVIQPIRKMLQRVEPVIEEMKTIISKAGPPEGGNGNGYSRPSSSGGFSAQKATLDDNRFARYGGNDLGRGLSILPLSYSSASEVIKKLSSPPSSLSSVTSMSSENEMSRRFGITNRPTRVDEGNSYSQKQSTTTNDNNNNNNINDEAANTKTDYNDIIKEYITKFLEPSRAPGAKSGSSKSNKHSLKINPQSIKMFNVPLKSMPSTTIDSIKPYNKGSDQQQPLHQQGSEQKPKFKIIKEFRVTLEDLKKLKLAPFVLQAKANALQMANKGGSSSSSSKNSFNSRFSSTLKDWTNFSTPLSASSFRPLQASTGMAVQESNPVNIIARLHNSRIGGGPSRRMGDAPMPTYHSFNSQSNIGNSPAFSRRQLEGSSSLKKRQSGRQPISSSSSSPSLKGISPPNIVFAAAAAPASTARDSHDSVDRAFRRSAEDQAFFESKRLRA